MSSENPFAKIHAARAESDNIKLQASREPGTLNPRGLGGPLFDKIKARYATLGASEEGAETTQVQEIRRLFEAKLRRRGDAIYEALLAGKAGSPKPEEFENDVETAFQRGFDLYLKVALRLDEKSAPEPHAPYSAYEQGKGLRTIRDEHDKNFYLERFIQKGNEVANDLNSHHTYEPIEGAVGYQHKYQQVPGSTPEESSLDAYMFEKLRLYSAEFFDMLEESLRQGVSYENSVELATYVYGNNASVYSEMAEHGIDADVVAWQSKVNRARVRVSLEKYIEVGRELEQNFPYDPELPSWVRSPKTVRNLTFKHPQTIEQGLPIVARELPRLSKTYPHVPQRLLVEECVASPDEYEERIRELAQRAEHLMSKYPMEEGYGGRSSENMDVFSYYHVEGAFMLFMDKVSDKKIDEEIARALLGLKNFVERAETTHTELSYSTRRRMLRSLLLSLPTARAKIYSRETRIAQKRNDQHRSLLENAEIQDPVWGAYVVDCGFGQSETETLENGQAIVQLVREQLGDADGEEYLLDVLETYERYIAAGFPENPDDRSALKDALLMAPYATRHFYEDTLKRTWPTSVKEIAPLHAEK